MNRELVPLFMGATADVSASRGRYNRSTIAAIDGISLATWISKGGI